MTASVSDDILAAFDNVMAGGDTLPLEEIRKRYAGSDYFRYRDHQLYRDIIKLPLSVEMITGEKASAVPTVIKALRELYGDDLMFDFASIGDEVTLRVRMWKDEATLRSLWREYAEETYKSEMLGGAK